MAARRNQGPAKPQSGIFMLGAVAGAGYGIYSGYPGLAAVWLGLLVSAWTYPPAIFTGKKDMRGYPTPGGPGEQSAMNKYRFWEDLKFKLVLPTGDWLPGFKPSLSWLTAVWAATAAYFVPVSDPYTGPYGHWINAAAVFIAIAQTAASRRRTVVAGDENPGARIDSLIALARKSTPKVIALSIGGLALGAALGTIASVMLPLATEAAGVPAIPEGIIWLILLTGAPIALLAKPWITEALEHWLIVVAAREEWDQRWLMLKQDPAPRLIDRQEVGPAIVDTFDAPATTGAMTYWAMGPKIGPTIGTGAKFAVMSTENLDSQGQPVPGTRHPLRFEIVRWPSDQIPDISDPSMDRAVLFQLMRCALVWAGDDMGLGRPILDDVHLLTKAPAPAEDAEDGTPAPAPAAGSAAWAVTWHLPDGPGPTSIRASFKGSLSNTLNAEVLVDHRAMGGNGCMYAGALTDPDTSWDPSMGVNSATMKNLSEEDIWDQRWIEVMKQGSNPPVVQAPTARSARLANGVTVNTIAFVTRQGMPPHEFFQFENKMPTVMDAAPYVTLTGYQGDGKRPGERHPQAFSIIWSDKPVPAKPDDLAPAPRSDAPKWVLAGRMNEAFKAARLADRPEIVTVTCLTKPESRSHIWRIDLRLHGGVTLAEVRGAVQKIRQSWGSEWLRVAAAKDGCTIVVGASPSRVKLADPRHEQYLASLDWEQAWLDAKISGVGGLLPKLVDVGHMPLNPQVKILEFDLEGTGLDFARLKEARATLEATSGNSFVDFRRIKDTATRVQVLASEVNPMPEHAPYDYAAIDKAAGIPFSTGVEGEPVEFSIKDHIHLMVVGGSGSGKSVILQSLITGALRRGCDLYIADPTKGAADFTFAEPYSKAFCNDLISTGAMMKGVYGEVKRRVALNTKHGVGSYRNLPADIRPPHIVVVLDEFTSLIAPDSVPKPSEDPEIEAERDVAMAINAAKAEIGAFTAKISREARSAGVTLLLATQKLIQKDLDDMPGGSTLKVNLSRLIAGKSTHGERMSALKDAANAPTMGDSIPAGRAIFEPVTSGPVLIQCWYDKREQAALSEYVALHCEPLADDEKLDLTQFQRRSAASNRPAPGAIVDLGEMEIDMGELDLGEMELEMDDLELDGDTPDTDSDADGTFGASGDYSAEPDGMFFAAGDESTFEAIAPDAVLPTAAGAAGVAADTVMFVDLEGSLLPFRHGDDLTALIVPGHGTVAYRADIAEALTRTPVRQFILSSWEEDSVHVGEVLPRAEGFLTGSTEDHAWWKIDAVLDFLADNPEVKRIVWIDDELAGEDPILGIPMLDIARDAFAGTEAHLVVPEPFEGITGAHLAGIDRFLGYPGQLPAGDYAPLMTATPGVSDELPSLEELPDLPAAPELSFDGMFDLPEPDGSFDGSVTEEEPASTGPAADVPALPEPVVEEPPAKFQPQAPVELPPLPEYDDEDDFTAPAAPTTKAALPDEDDLFGSPAPVSRTVSVPDDDDPFA